LPDSEKEHIVVISWKQILVIITILLVSTVALYYLWKEFAPGMTLLTDKAEYERGAAVLITGWIRQQWFTPTNVESVAIEVRSGENIVWIDQVNTDASGHLSSSFQLRDDAPLGDYGVYASCSLFKSSVTFRVRS
jgi:hypothetical protein